MQSQSLLFSAGTSAWRSYCHQLKRRPLATKAATGIVGSILGDAIAQYASAHSSKRHLPQGAVPIVQYDWGRMMRLCTYSALIGTPCAHFWFGYLDKAVHAGKFTALAKMVLDQAVMAPLGIALFFVSVGMMEGQSPQAAVSSMKAKLKPTLLANWGLWPAANYINFAMVPPDQRILYVNVVYVFWASFLSTMAAEKPKEPVAA